MCRAYQDLGQVCRRYAFVFGIIPDALRLSKLESDKYSLPLIENSLMSRIIGLLSTEATVAMVEKFDCLGFAWLSISSRLIGLDLEPLKLIGGCLTIVLG